MTDKLRPHLQGGLSPEKRVKIDAQDPSEDELETAMLLLSDAKNRTKPVSEMQIECAAKIRRALRSGKSTRVDDPDWLFTTVEGLLESSTIDSVASTLQVAPLDSATALTKSPSYP